MKTTELIFHPHLEDSLVNKMFAQAVGEKDQVTMHNMYNLYPDFKIDVLKEQVSLLAADRVVLQFLTYGAEWVGLRLVSQPAARERASNRYFHWRRPEKFSGLAWLPAGRAVTVISVYGQYGGDEVSRLFFNFGRRPITELLLGVQARKYANYISQDKALLLLRHFATEEDYRIKKSKEAEKLFPTSLFLETFFNILVSK